jgi:general secretion pathway protein F
MPLYSAKIHDKHGIRKSEIQARTEAEARKHFERTGKVISIEKKSSFVIARGLSPEERQIFFTRMSSMLHATVGTSEALRLMRDTFTGKIQEISGRLLALVESGQDLASAMEQIGQPDFPETTVALIKAGARTGDSWRAIKDAAEFEYQLHTIKKGSAKGLWTGILSFIGAGLMILASTFYVGPEIMNSPLMKAMKAEDVATIDFINQIAVGITIFMGILMVIGMLGGLLASVGRQVMPVKADEIIMKVPYYKDLVLSKNNYIVLYGLSLLIRAKVRIEEALRLSAESAPKGALRIDLFAALNAVKKGQPWMNVMKTLHPTDRAALLCATSAEQIAITLDILANQYRDIYAQRLASFVPLLNMVAAIFMTVAGGIIFAQTVLPMLMTTQGML